jgi:hypothetical protein
MAYAQEKRCGTEKCPFRLDGYDTLFLARDDFFMKEYQAVRNGKEIVISAEKYCFPDTGLASYFPVKDSPFAYVNSGGIIGSVKGFKKALDTLEVIDSAEEKGMDNAFSFSNQYLWTLYSIRYPQEITLDINCRIFQTLTPEMASVQSFIHMNNPEERKEYAKNEFSKVMEDMEIRDTFSVFNRITQTKPCHLHFNSPLSKYTMFQDPFLNWIELLNSEK